jgi:hypothetical protein
MQAAARGDRRVWLAVDGTPNGVRVNWDHVYANGLLAVRWAKLRSAAHPFGNPASKSAGLRAALRKICSLDQTKYRGGFYTTDMSSGGAT